MKRKKNSYEKPNLEHLDVVGKGQSSNECATGSLAAGACSSVGNTASGSCNPTGNGGFPS
jgi:hypothetical protein